MCHDLHSVTFVTGRTASMLLNSAMGAHFTGRALDALVSLALIGDPGYTLAICNCGWVDGSPFGPMIVSAASGHLVRSAVAV